MVLKTLRLAKRQKSSPEWRDGPLSAALLSLGILERDRSTRIVERYRFRQFPDTKPVADKRFGSCPQRLTVAHVNLLPVVHRLAGAVAPAWDPVAVLERFQQFRQPIRPAPLEVNVLSVRDEKRSIEIRQP